MIKEEDIQKAKDATFPIPEGGRSYEQSLAASGFELGARWASAFNEPNISFKEQMIRSCIEIALTDVSEKRFSDYGTSLKECFEWIEEQQNKIAFYEKQGDTTSDIRYDGINAGASLSVVNGKPFDYEHATITQKDFAPEDKCAGCNNIKGCVACIDGDNWAHYYYEDEQKQEWSEEDERICQCLIEDQEESLNEVRNDKYGHSEIISDLKEMYRERINWLKSLKDRVQGKED